MNNYIQFFSGLAVMAGVTYLVRMLPLVLVKKKIENRLLSAQRLSLVSVALCCCLIYAMGHFPDRSPGAVQGLNGATMLLENVGSYVLVGVICFIAAVVVTVFCTRLRKKNNKQEERTKEDEEA